MLWFGKRVPGRGLLFSFDDKLWGGPFCFQVRQLPSPASRQHSDERGRHANINIPKEVQFTLSHFTSNGNAVVG